MTNSRSTAMAMFAGGLAGFALMALAVTSGWTAWPDHLAFELLRGAGDQNLSIGAASLGYSVRTFASLGSRVTMFALATPLLIGLLMARRHADAVFLAMACAGGAILSSTLKHLFGRPRPEILQHLDTVHSSSFPSGHATTSTIFWLALAAIAASAARDPALRRYTVACALLIALLVGVSRVYLAVHWPSDVVAGWCLGTAWIGLCLTICPPTPPLPLTPSSRAH